MSDPVVIVGSGMAGYAVAREFRRLDKTTPLLIVSRDHGGFYSKPMLSNALAGNKTAATLVMKSADKMAAELGATVRPLTEVLSIDAAARRIVLGPVAGGVSGAEAAADATGASAAASVGADALHPDAPAGETLAYRDLVLAPGADPIRLPLEGDAADEVMSVNDLDDFARFAERLAGAQRVAILGAGLIGCEFANDLLARGIEPTVIDIAERPLSRLLPEAAGQRLRERLEAAGVRFRFGVGVQRVSREGDRLSLALSDGSVLATDRVLSAIGLQPRTALARAAGLAVNRGIVTDRQLATSEAHVYAVGDAAEVEGHVLPYVMPLMQQGRALAATLAGTPTPVQYPAMPVVVKTPACPTIVCPPPPGAAGQWQVTASEDGCEARFEDAGGVLLGFALLGSATAQKQALAAQVPALIGT
jgi:rubredoxin-NAD+ reductase